MTSTPATSRQGTMDLMAKAVLLSIALGLCLQLIVLVVKLFAGSDFPGVRLVPDIAGSVVWSVLVCAGVAFGTLIMRAGVALSGIIGIFLAPVALFAAKIMQESLGFALGIAAGGVTQTVVILGVIKGSNTGFSAPRSRLSSGATSNACRATCSSAWRPACCSVCSSWLSCSVSPKPPVRRWRRHRSPGRWQTRRYSRLAVRL